jgi:translation initiation factor 2 beta subunit (eIF-2beta)/eIF-5
MYDEKLKETGSIRKAAEALGLTKSKFMVLWKKELGLCTATTGCQNKCLTSRTRCAEHLKYAVETRDKNKQKLIMEVWRKDNAQHIKDSHRIYQRANKDRINAHNRKYIKTEKGKAVNREKSAYRRALKKQATPPWIDRKVLKEIYANCPKGYHVDHIIPLESDDVCGLHVPANLQYLSAFENDSKGNRFDGTYQNESWRKFL